MEVIGHQDEGVELVALFRAVVAKELKEEVGVRVGLEKAVAVGGDGGNEVGAEFGREEFHVRQVSVRGLGVAL